VEKNCHFGRASIEKKWQKKMAGHRVHGAEGGSGKNDGAKEWRCGRVDKRHRRPFQEEQSHLRKGIWQVGMCVWGCVGVCQVRHF